MLFWILRIFSILLDQYVRRNSKAFFKLPDHANAQWTLSVEHIRDLARASKILDHIFSSQGLLFHAVFDRLDWIRQGNWELFFLVLIYQQSQHFEFTSLM